MAIKIFESDPRANRLPKTTGISGRLKPFKPLPLTRPELDIRNNPRIQANLKRFEVTSPEITRQNLLENLSRQVDTINAHIQGSMQFKGLRFSVHEASNRQFVTIRDQRSGEVLKTFPAQQILDLAGRLQDLSGLLVNVSS